MKEVLISYMRGEATSARNSTHTIFIHLWYDMSTDRTHFYVAAAWVIASLCFNITKCICQKQKDPVGSSESQGQAEFQKFILNCNNNICTVFFARTKCGSLKGHTVNLFEKSIGNKIHLSHVMQFPILKTK